MKKTIVLLSLILMSACCTTRPTPDIVPGDAEAFINRSNIDFTAAAGRGDVDTMMKMYADNAVLLPPNQPIMRGPGVREYWSETLKLGKIDATIVADEVIQSCDLATEIGTYKFAITTADGKSFRDTGKYVVTWRKRAGQWHAIADIFNSDLPK